MNLDPHFAADATIEQGCRELVANAFDAAETNTVRKCESAPGRLLLVDSEDAVKGYIQVNDTSITCVNFKADVPPGKMMFRVGGSRKSSDSIGGFGEGINVFCAVVARLFQKRGKGHVTFKGVFYINGKFQARIFRSRVDGTGTIVLDSEPCDLDSDRLEVELTVPGDILAGFRLTNYAITNPDRTVTKECPGRLLVHPNNERRFAVNNMFLPKMPRYGFVYSYNLFFEAGSDAIDRSRKTIHLTCDTEKAVAHAISSWLTDDPLHADGFLEKMENRHNVIEQRVLPYLSEEAKAILRAAIRLAHEGETLCCESGTDSPVIDDEETVLAKHHVVSKYLMPLFCTPVQELPEVQSFFKTLIDKFKQAEEAEWPAVVTDTLAVFGKVVPVHGGDDTLEKLLVWDEDDDDDGDGDGEETMLVNVDAIDGHEHMSPERLLCYLLFGLKAIDVANDRVQELMMQTIMTATKKPEKKKPATGAKRARDDGAIAGPAIPNPKKMRKAGDTPSVTIIVEGNCDVNIERR